MQNRVPASFWVRTAMVNLLGVLQISSALGQETVEPKETATQLEIDTSGESTGEMAVTPAVTESGAVLDYEPTESISEDRSVSFPVDI